LFGIISESIEPSFAGCWGGAWTFPPAEYETKIQSWIEQVAKPEGEGWTQQDYEMHVREEHSTFAWIIEGMLNQVGFNILEKNYISSVLTEYLCEKIA
jgi:putative AdoMet-dependent methyltransferase